MSSSGRPKTKSHPSTFQTRTARDDAGELNRRFSTLEPQSTPSPPERYSREETVSPYRIDTPNPYDPATNDSTPLPRRHSFTKRLLHLHNDSDDAESPSGVRKRSVTPKRKSHVTNGVAEDSVTAQMYDNSINRKTNGDASNPKPGLGPRPVGGTDKLGTFSGVFVPTCLNVLSILMFLRFGFILGQGGVVGTMGETASIKDIIWNPD
jgi:potassium/chloride transporter 9